MLSGQSGDEGGGRVRWWRGRKRWKHPDEAASLAGSSHVAAYGGAGGYGTDQRQADISGGAGGDGRIRFVHT